MTGMEDEDEGSGSFGRLVQCEDRTISCVGYRVTFVLEEVGVDFGAYTASICVGGTA